jgi:hypothetical protein
MLGDARHERGRVAIPIRDEPAVHDTTRRISSDGSTGRVSQNAAGCLTKRRQPAAV